MRGSLLACVLMAVGVLACAATPSGGTPNKQINPDRFVGWLHGKCFAVRNGDIPSGARLLVVKLGDVQQTVRSEVIRKVKPGGDECNALLDDRKSVNLGSGASFYAVSSKEPIELGIGVVQPADTGPVSADAMLDVNGDGRKDTFAQCTTSEGMKFSVWDGEAYKSNLIWSAYYYLGYDMQANCPSGAP